MKRSFALLSLLATLTGTLAVSHPAAYALESSERQPATHVVSAATLNCNQSPFGKTLPLGGENELFLSFTSSNAVRSDRLDISASGNLVRQAEWPGVTGDTSLLNVSSLTSTAVDADGDGEFEFVQVFKDANGTPRIATQSNKRGSTIAQVNGGVGNNLAAAAGNLMKDANEYVVLAGTINNGLQVMVLNPLTGQVLGNWISTANNRTNPTLIRTAVADLDGDSFANEIVVAFREADSNTLQMIALQYQAGAVDPTATTAFNLRSLVYGSWTAQTFSNLQIALGNVDDDPAGEITVARSYPSYGTGYATIGLDVYDFSYGALSPTANRGISRLTSELALGVGDTDRDGRGEIVVGYNDIQAGPALTITSYDVLTAADKSQTLEMHNSWQNATNGRVSVAGLSLGVADLDRNTYADIVAAFRDANSQLQVIQLIDTMMPTPQGLTLTRLQRDGTGGRNTAANISVHLADWDNNSLKAVFAPTTSPTRNPPCETTDPQIKTAIFVPPYWQKLQQDRSNGRYGYIGKGTSASVSKDSTVTYEQSETFTAYAGLAVDGEVAAASAKITAGRQYSWSQTNGSGTQTSTTLKEAYTNPESFVVFGEEKNACYNYNVQSSGTNQGQMRFCVYRPEASTQDAKSLDTWDAGYGPLDQQTVPGNKNASQYAPVARDWSSLTLFREQTTAQSDGAGADITGRAVDGNTDGNGLDKVTVTAQQNAPWWQVDLGSSQDISKIRLWNRTDTSCGVQPCSARLANFYVFVSDKDFRTLPNSNNPEVLKNTAGVRSYPGTTPYTIAGRVTTILTARRNALNPDQPLPIKGRYVRIQLRDAGVLSLAEVQVFGPNHVDPDRYPRAVRDTVKGDDWFEAEVYNSQSQTWQWKRVRGNLLWTPPAGKIDNKTVGPGTIPTSWSLEQEAAESRTTGTAYSYSSQVGMELDVESGFVAQVIAGGGYEKSRGITQAESQTVTIGQSFEIGGSVEGFSGLQLNQCTYKFRPFYYETSEESSFGFTHRFVAVDYTVPDTLNRAANLDACRPEPSVQPDTYKMYMALVQR